MNVCINIQNMVNIKKEIVQQVTPSWSCFTYELLGASVHIDSQLPHENKNCVLGMSWSPYPIDLNDLRAIKAANTLF